MKPTLPAMVLVAAAVLGVSPVTAAPATAQRPGATVCTGDQAPDATRSRHRVATIRESVYRILARADEAMANHRSDAARDMLEQALGRSSINANEAAQLHNMLARLSLADGAGGRAIHHLEAVLGQRTDIPTGLETQALYTLAQLYFLDERFADARTCLSTWFTRVDEPGGEPHVLMARIHYALGNLAAATADVERAVAIAREQRGHASEDWRRLLVYFYVEQERWQPATGVVESLVRDHGKREYWLQLAGLYGQQGLDSRRAYALEAAHVGGLLTRAGDRVTYARVLLQEEVPFRAAWYLERAIASETVPADSETLALLSQAWSLAQETDLAIDAMERAVAQSPDSRLLVRLATLDLYAERFDECGRQAARVSVDAVEDPGSLLMLRARCAYHAGELPAAKALFERAREHAADRSDARTAAMATNWLRHLEAEAARRRALANSAVSRR